jgi:hypothetical protein
LMVPLADVFSPNCSATLFNILASESKARLKA